MKRAPGTLGTKGRRFYSPTDYTHFLLLLLLRLLDWTDTSPEKHQLQKEPWTRG